MCEHSMSMAGLLASVSGGETGIHGRDLAVMFAQTGHIPETQHSKEKDLQVCIRSHPMFCIEKLSTVVSAMI
jgi:hypothetical protein